MSDIEELQENLDELEQYSRKNSLELHGIPEDIDLSTDEVVCKVAQAIGVEGNRCRIDSRKHRDFTSTLSKERTKTDHREIL